MTKTEIEAVHRPKLLLNGSNQDGPAEAELPVVLGQNLRRLRTRRGLSLERLAKLSGVSRAMLGQIENGRSVPTISLLWKVANALEVPFANLLVTEAVRGTQILRREAAKILSTSRGKFTSRALFPFDGERRVEFYELRLAAHHTEDAEGHSPGTCENLVVVRGTVEITAANETPVVMSEGDAIVFEADQPHRYRNLSPHESLIYLVMTYVETVG